jgi:hypothetical protein
MEILKIKKARQYRTYFVARTGIEPVSAAADINPAYFIKRLGNTEPISVARTGIEPVTSGL